MPKIVKKNQILDVVLPNAFLRLTAILAFLKKNSTFCHTQKFKQKSIKNR